MKKRTIDDIYFGVATVDFNDKKLHFWNLFQNGRVKWSVACYITMKEEDKKHLTDPFRFCFGDVGGRVEYEMQVTEMFDKGENWQKTDVYELFCLPNKEHLMDLVNSVSVNSARAYIRSERKAYKEAVARMKKGI